MATGDPFYCFKHKALFCSVCQVEAEEQHEARIVDLERTVTALRALVAELREAGVTDYSKLGTGSHRVDCHFCGHIWKSGDKPKHYDRCALALTEADMLKRLGMK